MTHINFYDFSPNANLNPSPTYEKTAQAWRDFFNTPAVKQDIHTLCQNFSDADWQNYTHTWQNLDKNDDKATTDWLIDLFNRLFNQIKDDTMPTILVRGDGEPEYFPAQDDRPARIEFAHGFFASSLHEISHWCIAGKRRRTLNDFGYWYEADGRDARTQAIFEQVEIKPQAIECLLNQALGRYFYVSQDNLNADFDTSQSTFAADVYQQARNYLNSPTSLPKDAQRLLWVFLKICQHFS